MMKARYACALWATMALTLAAPAAAQQNPPKPVPDTVIEVRDTVLGVPDTVQAATDTVSSESQHPSSIILKTPVPTQQQETEPPRGAPKLLGRPLQGAASAPAAAPGAEPAAEATTAEERTEPREHVVKRGDTLWDLAASYLSDPFQWPRIFEANRDVVENPHWIYPNERLVIPGLFTTVAGPNRGVTAPPGSPVDMVAVGSGGIQWNRKLPRTRFYRRPPPPPSFESAKERPLVSEMEFRSAPWLQRRSTVRPHASFLRVFDPRTPNVSSVASQRAVHPQDAVYLSYAKGVRPEVGESLLLVHAGEKVGDWGTMMEPTALVRIASLGRDVITATVQQQYSMVEEGDVALPLEPAPSLRGVVASPVDNGARGRILAFESDSPLPSVGDQLFVDLGSAQVRPGDELVAYLPERKTAHPTRGLPAEPIARLLIVRTTDRTATARVIALSEAVLKVGLPVRVYKKVP